LQFLDDFTQLVRIAQNLSGGKSVQCHGVLRGS
jgi:hypothetical protein